MKKEMRILNVGCGEETFGTHFLDLYPSRPEVIKCDVNFQKFPFQDNFFNEVYAYNLLEHIINYFNFFNECNRVLKKGGKIVITTPNAIFWSIFGKVHYGGYVGRGVEDKHYALFTPIHLRDLLIKAGFGNITTKYFIDDDNLVKSTHKIFVRFLSFFSKKLCPQIKAIAYKRVEVRR